MVMIIIQIIVITIPFVCFAKLVQVCGGLSSGVLKVARYAGRDWIEGYVSIRTFEGVEKVCSLGTVNGTLSTVFAPPNRTSCVHVDTPSLASYASPAI
jgi:hypothetical protein